MQQAYQLKMDNLTCSNDCVIFKARDCRCCVFFEHADKAMAGRYGRLYVYANSEQRVLRDSSALSIALVNCLTHSTIVILSFATCHPVV